MNGSSHVSSQSRQTLLPTSVVDPPLFSMGINLYAAPSHFGHRFIRLSSVIVIKQIMNKGKNMQRNCQNVLLLDRIR